MGVATNPNPLARMGIIDPRDYGARADGVTDCTAALNAAMLAAAPGSTIYFPPGTWAFAGNVTCQPGVSLLGAQRYRAGMPSAGDTAGLTLAGTIFAITGGHGTSSASATPFLTPPPGGGNNSAIENLAFWYPNQGNVDDGTIVGYPYTIGSALTPTHGSSANVTVRNCMFANSYQAIRFWSLAGFVIDNCAISAAVNGIWVDDMTDTSRIQGCRVEPLGFAKSSAGFTNAWQAYAQANLIAYRYGRVDSLVMLDCMCYPAKTGVLLEYTGLSGASGAFRPWFYLSNCTIDGADICVDAQAIASQGVRFSNCTFASWSFGSIPNNLCVRVGSGAGAENGVLTIANSQLGNGATMAHQAGARCRYIGCTFAGADGSAPAIVVTGGDASITGCDFRNAQPQMSFAGGGKAIFANNTSGPGGVSVTGVTPSNCA